MTASVASNDDTLLFLDAMFLSTLEILLLSMLGETMEKIVVGVEFVVEIISSISISIHWFATTSLSCYGTSWS